MLLCGVKEVKQSNDEQLIRQQELLEGVIENG